MPIWHSIREVENLKIERKIMKFQIVVCEQGWIIGALAEQLYNTIRTNFGKKCEAQIVYGEPHWGADAYIHFIYLDTKIVEGARNLVYVTHIDYTIKLMLIFILHLKNAEFIVMSNQTYELINTAIPTAKIHLLNPTSIHFSRNEKSNSYLRIGLFYRIYDDNRKNTLLIKKLISFTSKYKENTKLVVYGRGFRSLVNDDNCDYIECIDIDFEKEKYCELIKSCDYVTYFGMDEGAISILDAATLNIPVIATKQGYHLDIKLAKGSVLFDTGVEVFNFLCNLIESNCQNNSDIKSQLFKIISFEKKLNNYNLFSYFRILIIPFVKNPFRRDDDLLYFLRILCNKINKLFKT
jgi:hypothetical protein